VSLVDRKKANLIKVHLEAKSLMSHRILIENRGTLVSCLYPSYPQPKKKKNKPYLVKESDEAHKMRWRTAYAVDLARVLHVRLVVRRVQVHARGVPAAANRGQ
jgi:hypothetical protein